MSNPLLILGSPALPNVPDLPGVPPIARTLGVEAVAAIGMLDPSLEAAIFGGAATTQWGVFDMQGNQVLTPDSFVRMEIDEPYVVSNYPVEKGSFASYNKVKQPEEGTVTLAKGGSAAERGAFLHAAKGLQESLKSYQIVVPEGAYYPVTIDRVSYERRTGGGAYLILVHLHFKEIRIAPPIQYGPSGQKQPTSQVPASAQGNKKTTTGLPNPTSTTSPTSQAMANAGSVGASLPSGAVSSALNAAVPVSNW